jgi:4-hydroxybutyryl-CoA dehydratase/vinylacetyl-CoA-Delta-isomerase
VNPDEYRASLSDGRRIFYDGELVTDVATHPKFRVAADNVASGYGDGHAGAGERGLSSADAYKFPTSPDELRARMESLTGWEPTLLMTLESLLALGTTASRMPGDGAYAVYRQRIDAFVEFCREADRRCVPTISDAKGHRALTPEQQSDPDLYTRIVERSDDGIVIRGAKLHISGAAVAHELLVMPTKRMKPGEEQWAVACAVPLNSPGVTVMNTVPLPPADEWEYHPNSSRGGLPEGFVVFDDVFVPHERVFLAGEVAHSATFAHSIGLWQRIGGAAHMAEGADLLVGLARLLAEANGVEKIPHIREKIADMIVYATLVRSGLEAAIENAVITPEGFATPNELYTNVAKYYGSLHRDRMLTYIHDIAGGAILTAPMPGDLANPETRAHVDKYMATRPGVDGAYRTRLFHAARDLTVSSAAGHHQVAMIMSGGGLFAQKLVATMHYDLDRARGLALRAAGLASPASPASPTSPERPS